jgi:hypothetical protein
MHNSLLVPVALLGLAGCVSDADIPAMACILQGQEETPRSTAPLEATTALWRLLEEGHATSRLLKNRERRVAPSAKHVFARFSESQHIEILLS